MDPDLLAFVPKPVKAVLILFPVTEKYEEHRKAEDFEIRSAGKEGYGQDLLYFKQTVSRSYRYCAFVPTPCADRQRLRNVCPFARLGEQWCQDR